MSTPFLKFFKKILFHVKFLFFPLFALFTIAVKLQLMPCHGKIRCIIFQMYMCKRAILQRDSLMALQAHRIMRMLSPVQFVYGTVIFPAGIFQDHSLFLKGRQYAVHRRYCIGHIRFFLQDPLINLYGTQRLICHFQYLVYTFALSGPFHTAGIFHYLIFCTNTLFHVYLRSEA